jgi:hypothetical protein
MSLYKRLAGISLQYLKAPLEVGESKPSLVDDKLVSVTTPSWTAVLRLVEQFGEQRIIQAFELFAAENAGIWIPQPLAEFLHVADKMLAEPKQEEKQ